MIALLVISASAIAVAWMSTLDTTDEGVEPVSRRCLDRLNASEDDQ